MAIKIRAVPQGWTLLVEMWVEPDGMARHYTPIAPIHFKNGEQLLGVEVVKPVGGPFRKPGLFRLYRSKLGHPKFRASPHVRYHTMWAPRPHAYNQPMDGPNV